MHIVSLWNRSTIYFKECLTIYLIFVFTSQPMQYLELLSNTYKKMSLTWKLVFVKRIELDWYVRTVSRLPYTKIYRHSRVTSLRELQTGLLRSYRYFVKFIFFQNTADLIFVNRNKAFTFLTNVTPMFNKDCSSKKWLYVNNGEIRLCSHNLARHCRGLNNQRCLFLLKVCLPLCWYQWLYL